MIAELKNDRTDAKTRYASILAKDPNAAVAANNLAWIYADEGTNLDQALLLAQTAIKAFPDRAQVQDTFGWVLYQRGYFRDAAAALERAAAADPSIGEIQYHLGLAYAKAGESVRARETLNAALKLDPESGLAAEARKSLDEISAFGQ
jgi:Tfp pilus assembly protein PilF